MILPAEPATAIVSISGIITTLLLSIEINWSRFGAKSNELGNTVILIAAVVSGKKLFNSLTHCMTSIYQKNGIKGLYQGLGISLASIFSYRGMYFGFFDTGKKMINNYDNKPFWFKFCFAQVLTMSSETINYPFDTVRRRMMMNSGLKQKLFNNSIECMNIIYKQEGMIGFFKGNLSNMVRSISSSLVLVLYDEFQRKLKKKF